MPAWVCQVRKEGEEVRTKTASQSQKKMSFLGKRKGRGLSSSSRDTPSVWGNEVRKDRETLIHAPWLHARAEG